MALVSYIFTLLLSPTFAAAAASGVALPLAARFDAWCEKYGKSYASEAERTVRLASFADNAAFVDAHNAAAAAGAASYELAINAFADLTHSEFRASRLGLAARAPPEGPAPGRMPFRPRLGAGAVPASIDWRDRGAVTVVKDQGSCGACWSFSTTGAIEGINQISTGTLVSLSEQELIDCDRSYDVGCNGGLMDYAFKWVIDNKGIDSESDYPFKMADGTCNQNKVKRKVVTIDGYTDVPAGDEDALLKAVATQPVSIGICGSERGFQFYSKGIFTGPCSTSLDHAVLIVGYGSENGQDYWILKNSWGTSWGMDGYMHILRNGSNKDGVCGMNKMASYPIKTSPNPPPSPGPGPTKCSLLTYCPAGSTCCCSSKLLWFCLSWSCCELDSAVCCKDHRFCCPQNYPVCDTAQQQCLKNNYGNISSTEGIKMRQPLTKYSSVNGIWDMLDA